ncbi:MAG TPA: hypothetical protein VL860_07755 [Planctomycetota bacterium]|nr:hypothetical protein [Planctomycetota bacterium]
MRSGICLLTVVMSWCCAAFALPLAAGQAAPPLGGPALVPVRAPATGAKPESFRLANGKTVIGVVVNEDKNSVVIFNGAGNLAVRVRDIVWRKPGGELEAGSTTAVGLVTVVAAKPATPPATLSAPADPTAGAGIEATVSLNELLRTPELYLSSVADRVKTAGPGPTLIELESLYRVRPVNRAEAYAQLHALEAKADAMLAPIAGLSAAELKTELMHSEFSNEETFGEGKYARLSLPDERRLVALKRLLHLFNKDNYYTYAVNATFTDLLNPRRPMGDCNSSAALVYHLLWHAGYADSVGLFVDVQEHHAVLRATCDQDSRPYFGETTGGFLTSNPVYQKRMDAPNRDPAEDQVTVVASLINEGYPPGLTALQNLRLSLVLRLSSADPWSKANFKHYFVAYANGLLDRHDDAGLTAWSSLYDQVEGRESFANLPRAH